MPAAASPCSLLLLLHAIPSALTVASGSEKRPLKGPQSPSCSVSVNQGRATPSGTFLLESQWVLHCCFPAWGVLPPGHVTLRSSCRWPPCSAGPSFLCPRSAVLSSRAHRLSEALPSQRLGLRPESGGGAGKQVREERCHAGVLTWRGSPGLRRCWRGAWRLHWVVAPPGAGRRIARAPCIGQAYAAQSSLQSSELEQHLAPRPPFWPE